ncbi:MAG: hypothetical protein LC803_16755 [Acidobacteria bacterium]|nr:hypothetical protein [Acidobacteriota bacterium]
MHAHEIVDQALERGDAERLHDLTGKSAELFNSYRRQPKTVDHRNGTGNISPVALYLRFVFWLLAVNRRSACRLVRLVNQEIEERLEADRCRDEGTPLRRLSKDLLKQTTEAVCAMDEREIEEATDEELRVLDGELGDVDEEVGRARARVRAERRRRSAERR